MRVLEQLVLIFLWMSLIAIGGANAVVPEIHRQIVEQKGWISDTEFAHLFVLGQLAPGPNVLIVSVVGWRVAGWTGMIVATIAMLLPSSLLAFGTQRFLDCRPGSVWVPILRHGLVPLALGLLIASGLVMAKAADHGIVLIALTAVSTLFAFLTDRNPLWALAGCGMSAILIKSLGFML